MILGKPVALNEIQAFLCELILEVFVYFIRTLEHMWVITYYICRIREIAIMGLFNCYFSDAY